MRLEVFTAVALSIALSSAPSLAQKPSGKPAASSTKTVPAASTKVAPASSTTKTAQPADSSDGVPIDDLGLSPREKKILETVTRLKWTPGPTKVALGFDCTIDLPEAYQYLDVAQSKKLLEAYGHTHNEHVLGTIGPKSEEPWQVYLDYDDPGYIKDDEKLDADEIMKAMREGQMEVNKERVQLGHKALNLIGWSELPRYDRTAHHVVWGMTVRTDGDSEDSINYNTRVLGRKGYVAVNLVTDASRLAEFKSRAEDILKATTFNAGSRYEDHTGSDKVAEYGLAGLILGGAGLGLAKVAGKVGILALFAKGGKGALLLLAAPFLAIKKFLSGKKGNADAAPPPGGES